MQEIESKTVIRTSKDKNKHEAIGWERALRSHEENAINVEMVKMVRRVFK